MERVEKEIIRDLNKRFENEKPEEILKWLLDEFGHQAVLGTGFGPSGIVLIHHMKKAGLNIPVFYLDTSLFFEETYQLRDQIEEQFDIHLVRVSPDLSLDEQAEEYGSELWKLNPNKCCFIRKVLPLQRYLSDKKVWITGVRRSQSQEREKTGIFEWDPLNEVLKVNPLVSWTTDEIWTYIKIYELPYNVLHEEGYPSIGCAPCTKPVLPHEDERAGRWAGMDKTECGIHLPTQETK